MWEKIKNFLWKLFCEADEEYPDLVRITYALTVSAAIGMQFWAVVVNKQEFSMTDFSTIAAILFGGGAAIGIRGRLEDGPTNAKTGGE